jgi:hypothetical protein
MHPAPRPTYGLAYGRDPAQAADFGWRLLQHRRQILIGAVALSVVTLAVVVGLGVRQGERR